jgi:hypothetical protein
MPRKSESRGTCTYRGQFIPKRSVTKDLDKFRPALWKSLLLNLALCLIVISTGSANGQTSVQGVCTADFVSVSQPLNDLGPDEYVRLDGTPTEFIGGLYPNGSNVRPSGHEKAGVSITNGIKPLDALGQLDPAHGKIVMISVGMSNTRTEFDGFVSQADGGPSINSKLVLVNGAQGGKVSDEWADPNASAWVKLDTLLEDSGVAPLQVQVAWVKLAKIGYGDFPRKAELLQSDLEAVARNLKSRYGNIKIAYYSSRTRSYLYWTGLSPEPTAFETGFAVKWMIEKQISGDADLNFDPSAGEVVAPYLSWGPYLWINGLEARSDALIWTQNDLQEDCTHPSESGIQKVATQLMDFFKSDTTSKPWFLADPTSPSGPAHFYLPLVKYNLAQ